MRIFSLGSVMIRVDYSYMISEYVGEDHGISPGELKEFESRAKKALKTLEGWKESGMADWMDLPFRRDLLKDVLEEAPFIAGECDDFVVLGIGGSALGAKALRSAILSPYYNLLSKEKRGGRPRLWIADNVDPESFSSLLEMVSPGRTVFNVVSKSGSTAETISQFLIVAEKLKKILGTRYRERIVVTTDPVKGPLRKIAVEEGFRSFVVPPGVGGRFSVLSPVGTLPSAVAGIEVEALLAGAADMAGRCAKASIEENPALICAVLLYLSHKRKGKHIHVMMPYCDALYDTADWFRQLWAESLGKRLDLEGSVVNEGPTPVKALGATDQHSQLQLYVEGPFDKVVIFIRVEEMKRDVKIPRLFDHVEELVYLGDHSLGELLDAEERATEFSLAENERPNMTIVMPRLDEYHVGELFFMLEVQTALAGILYGINPFDQPGVEGGKHYVYGMMGRKGFEEKAAMMEMSEKRGDFVV